jgi:putative toxin-antitoxin system antitoxin component (TIGR02293 family)
MPRSGSSSPSTRRRVSRRTAAAGVQHEMTHPKVAHGKSAAKTGPKRKPALGAAKSKTTPGAPKKNRTGKLSYLSVYRASPLERISLIKKGVPAVQVKHLLADLHIAQGAGFKALNLSTATVNKKAKKGEVLSGDESERVIGFARLVGQLQAMVEESGDPSGFDARAWMARWLTEPLPAFGGTRPADLLDTMEGQGLVSAVLAKMQSGAYA